METHGTTTRSTAVPVTTPGQQGVGVTTTTSRGGRGELKESVGETGEAVLKDVAKKGEQLYHAACDACHNWRHYPKLLTVALLLTSFLLGAGSLGLVNKVGGWSKGSYVASHWDRNTADAHHALDVILDHLKHPELYEQKEGRSYLAKSRGKIADFLEGIMPSAWTRKTGKYYDEDHEGTSGWFGLGRKGGDGGDRGYMMKKGYGGRGITEELYDKMGNIKDELGYKTKYAADQAADVGYGITNKMSEMADAVKHKFSSGGGDDYVERGKETLKRGMGGMGMRGGGGYREDEDDIDAATEKLRRVVRKADRDL